MALRYGHAEERHGSTRWPRSSSREEHPEQLQRVVDRLAQQNEELRAQLDDERRMLREMEADLEREDQEIREMRLELQELESD